MPSYIKHLITCKCILPQLKDKIPPIFHSFIVFSVIDDNGNIEPSFAQCNNCRLIHRIIEINESTILNKQDMPSLLTAEEIKNNIPKPIIDAVEPYLKIDNLQKEADQLLYLHIWQEIDFIIRNQLWGKYVVLVKETMDDIITGKIIIILGESLYKIDNFTQKNYVELK